MTDNPFSDPAHKAPKEVLVVEDDTETAAMLRIVLEEEGYVVRMADNALDARMLLNECLPSMDQRVDLILMDLSMPGLDTTEMVVALKRNEGTLPPIIVMSARPTNMLQDAAASIGAACIVQKPFSIDELLQSMELALRTASV